MRTIKFRAKVEGQNIFAYGNLFKNTACTRILPEQAIIDEQNRIDERHVVDESTIGQFTGLTDKNGKEIYEGDVVNLHIFVEELGPNYGVCEGEREYVGFICFQELGLAFKRSTDDEEWFYLVYTPGMLHEESFDVIGNIHDNPELLK